MWNVASRLILSLPFYEIFSNILFLIYFWVVTCNIFCVKRRTTELELWWLLTTAIVSIRLNYPYFHQMQCFFRNSIPAVGKGITVLSIAVLECGMFSHIYSSCLQLALFLVYFVVQSPVYSYDGSLPFIHYLFSMNPFGRLFIKDKFTNRSVKF